MPATPPLDIRWHRVCQNVHEAVRSAGRDPSEVTLIAVSKLHPAEDIATVAGLGQVDFGENYVQEALSKQEALAQHPACTAVRWHMIGHIQSRKGKDVARRFVYIHSLDSLKLALGLETHLAAHNQRQKVLLQVNVGEEPQKSGVSIQDLPSLAEDILQRCPHLAVEGLMCLPPVFDAGMAARPHFAALRHCAEALRTQLGLPLPHLSMGMSGDFAAAILEGATMVRIGTDIFGPRPPKGTSGQ